MEASLIIPPLFRDGCLLQRGEATRFWGWFVPGGRIQVSVDDCVRETTAREDGSFFVLLALKGGGPYSLLVTARHPETGAIRRVAVRNILVGDLFFCGGQSNMELPMRRVRERFPEEEGNEAVRECKIPEETRFGPPLSCHKEIYWRSLVGEELEEASALGYFFSDFWQKTTGLPVGFINASRGGSPIEAWLGEESLWDDRDSLEEARAFSQTSFREAFLWSREREEAAWQKAIFDKEVEEAPVISSMPWKRMELPGFFSDRGLFDFSGCLYLRKDFYLEAVPEAALLKLGTLTDSDHVYVNGTAVGETAYSFPPRRYPISPGVLQKGNNRIEMRLLCRNGKGRFTPGKPYGLYDASGCFLDLSGEWKYKKAVIAPPAPEPDFLCRKATGLYNGMVHPLKGMTIRGILWYQGEANGQNPSRYGACLHRLIGEYRRIFSDSLLPFVVLQLPACDIDIEEGEAWPLLRNAQLSAAAIPGVSVTVNLDLGEANDLHPLDKKGAAHRAFLAMKKMTAGWKEGERKEGFWKNTVLGPRLIKYHWQGDRITLHFEAEGELSTKDKKACGEFFVRTSHGERMDARKAYPHNASIDLIFPGLSKKRQREVSLYYAWHRAPLSGLICDEGGLPLTPFCIRIQKEREICESL